MKGNELVYIMDVHCGWCYGNSDNFSAITNIFQERLEIELIVGGMWTGLNAPRGGKGFSQFIGSHSPQMEETTGALVSQKFHDLSKDESYVFSSLEPSAAIVLAKKIAPTKTVLFAKAVQHAIFVEGKRLDNYETYEPILHSLRINADVFHRDWLSVDNLRITELEFIQARQLTSGYPTLLHGKDSNFKVLAHGYFDKERIIQKIEDFLTVNTN